MGASNTWIRTSLAQGGTAAGKRRVRRVLIVDDHPIVRQGLRRVMENEDDLTVCGEAETARDARTAIKELNPDVVIADISLKQGDGIELVRDVRAHHPQLPDAPFSARNYLIAHCATGLLSQHPVGGAVLPGDGAHRVCERPTRASF